MRKGFTFHEVLIVVVFLVLFVAMMLPVFFAQNEPQEVVAEERFEQGDFAYLALDGRKVQVTSVQGRDVYLVRYADNAGHLEKISLFHFELTDDQDVRQTPR